MKHEHFWRFFITWGKTSAIYLFSVIIFKFSGHLVLFTFFVINVEVNLGLGVLRDVA